MPQTRATSSSADAETFVRMLITFCTNERKRQRISQREVAERMQTGKALVSKLESFKHDPTLHTLLKYILAIPGTIDQLLAVVLEMAEPGAEAESRISPDTNWLRHTPSYIVWATQQMRKQQGVTLVQMAERLGVSKTLLGNIEGGKEPTLDVLIGRLLLLDFAQGERLISSLTQLAEQFRPTV